MNVSTSPAMRVRATCDCPGDRFPPIRVWPGLMRWVESLPPGYEPDPDALFLTYKCTSCGAVVELTPLSLRMLST